jgi:hypothetical protein
MNTQLLIDAIMRQTTVLIAQLATTGGIRAPLSHIANQVFLDLARELNDQGISRKVSADMFGMALRAYIRKLQRLSESSTERGQSLWQAVLDFIASRPVVTRAEVLGHFHRDEPPTVRGILHDLTETGLVFSSGTGDATVFRSVGEEEARYARTHSQEGQDELLSVLIYREGPLDREELHKRSGMTEALLDAAIERLKDAGQVEVTRSGQLLGTRFHIPLASGKGWEAAVLDHYHALVRTICARLQQADGSATQPCGGATYTFEVWPGHPHEAEVIGSLARLRGELSELRERVEEHNAHAGLPSDHLRVVCYAGQHVIEQSAELDKANGKEPSRSSRASSVESTKGKPA